MALAHAALAWCAAGSLVLLAVVALVTATGRTGRSYAWLDRAVLLQAVTTGLSAVLGVATLGATRPPSDPLHLVYGAVATAAPLAVRAAAQGRDARSIGRWVAVAAAVAIGATVRSFMTGS